MRSACRTSSALANSASAWSNPSARLGAPGPAGVPYSPASFRRGREIPFEGRVRTHPVPSDPRAGQTAPKPQAYGKSSGNHRVAQRAPFEEFHLVRDETAATGPACSSTPDTPQTGSAADLIRLLPAKRNFKPWRGFCKPVEHKPTRICRDHRADWRSRVPMPSSRLARNR